LLILIVSLSVFSQTWAWYGDEGFHLLAAQPINSGKKLGGSEYLIDAASARWHLSHDPSVSTKVAQ
jgi:hypothetical protein